MNAGVPISFVLRESVDIRHLQEILRTLNIEVTGIGKVTISARLPLEQCEKLFDVHVTSRQPELPGEYDKGTPGGFVADKSLSIPKVLEPFITSATISSPMKRL